jgi:hypothetical protein
VQSKTVPEINVLAASRILRIPEVGACSAGAIPALEADAAAQNLAFTGPWIFVSHNLPQDATTTFDLKICRQIAPRDAYAGTFAVIDLPEFACAFAEYEGPLSGIFSAGYAPLLDAIQEAHAILTGEIREVYHVWGDPESPANRVEIQIGLG